jgi:hypothetical protein
MPTSSLRTLLTQFQSRYPMGCLSSDLLTIHQGQYVVRSVAQVGHTVLATGMASATDIEAAEDRSKIRVLEALGLGAGAGSSLSSASNPLPTSLSSPEPILAEPASPALIKSSTDRFSLPELAPELETEIVLPSVGLPKVGATAVSKAASQPPSASTESSLPSPSPLASLVDAHSVTNSLTSSAEDEFTTGSEMSASNNVAFTNSLSNRSRKSGSIESMESLEDGHDFPTDHALSESSPFSVDSSRAVDSTLTGTAAVHSPSSSPNTSPSAVKPEKAGKTTKRKPDTFELPPAPIPSRQPADRSEEIMKIGIEMKRLGWSTEQGREYLKRTYGKRSRQELDDAELLDFLRYLETQPAPMQTPF